MTEKTITLPGKRTLRIDLPGGIKGKKRMRLLPGKRKAEASGLTLLFPDRKTIRVIRSIQDALDADSSDQSAMDAMYDACAQVLSRNEEGYEFEASDLDGAIDIADAVYVVAKYSEFVGGVLEAEGKN